MTWDERQAWRIIGANIPKLANVMVGIPKGTWIDVYCDSAGKILSFSEPKGEASIKLCSMTAPDLERSYDVHKKGEQFFNGDDEEIPKEQLPNYLAESIVGMKDGGAEWGWEFKLAVKG